MELSVLKPLYANLKRLQIGKYLYTEEFDLYTIENDIDDEWKECKKDVISEKTMFIAGHHDYGDEEKAFFKLLGYLYQNNHDYFCEVLLEVLYKFAIWSKIRLDYTSIISNMKDLDIDTENIYKFTKAFRKVQENKPFVIQEEISTAKQKKASDSKSINKVFISHASTDKEFVEEIIELLETIGLESKHIFCSSFEGYGIELGQNFLERIKNELDENVLVLFILSENFYNSPVCLCEMGATWIKTNEHIPILIPPFGYNNIKGVIPLTQGFIINDAQKLNSFKQKMEKVFKIPATDFSVWERKRDRIVARINKKVNS